MLCEREEIETIKVDQGDIYENIEIINAQIIGDQIELKSIKFKNVLVLSQTCDLHREQEPGGNKEILTVLVVPLFCKNEFQQGTHLIAIEKEFSVVNKKLMERYEKGEHERYHVLNFDDSLKRKFLIEDDFVIDFRYFISVDIKVFENATYKASLKDLFKNRVTQRFANYLSRIGLPVLTYSNEEKV